MRDLCARTTKAIKATASLRREHRVDLCELFVDCGVSESVPIDFGGAATDVRRPVDRFLVDGR